MEGTKVNYKLIENTKDFYINEQGDIKDNISGKKVAIWKSTKDERFMVSLPYLDGKKRSNSVAFLVAKTFIPMLDGYSYDNVRVFFKDEDKTNHKLDNLEWRPKQYERVLNFERIVQANKKKFEVPKEFPRGNSNEPYFPIECRFKPNFYYLPNCDHPLVISKNGEVFNLDTGEYLNFHKHSGYMETRIRVNGNFKTVKQHRLLAFVFVGVPIHLLDRPIENLEVNHINGIKDDNRLANLEWVTSQENMNHAISTGLKNYDPIISKNILTNKVKIFNNCIDCARVFRISEKKLRRHVLSDKAGTLTKDWHVFVLAGQGFPILSELEKEENTWDRDYGVWVATNKETGAVKVANTKKDIVELIFCNDKDLQQIDLNTYSVGDWLLAFDTQPSADILKDLKGRFINKGIYKPIPIKVLDTLTGITTEYASCAAASKELQISSSIFTNRLKEKSELLVRDRYKLIFC